MESEKHPSSSLLLHQYDFSSLVSWPHYWQPEPFEIITNHISTSPDTNILKNQMTQVVPEHVIRAKLAGGTNNKTNIRKENHSTHTNRSQRSNSATLSTISVTCDTDTSVRSRNNRHQQSPSKKALISNNNITTSHSSSALMNASGNPPPPTSFHNYHQYKSSGNSLTSTSAMNIIHEKSKLSSSASTLSMPNKHLMKTTGDKGAGAVNRTAFSSRNISNKQRATSFDEHHHHREVHNRGIRKSVLEHLVFVFPENVRRILGGPKNLTVRTDESRQPVEPIDLGEPPSVEELKNWAESFDKLMLNPTGRRYFRDFLRSEYSEENFLFWMSCESLKNEQNPEIIEEKARLIYEDYISILSPKEVSLDSRVREVINKNMVEPSPHTFDEAQLQIYTLMHRDSYPRFINSQIYRRLLRSEDATT